VTRSRWSTRDPRPLDDVLAHRWAAGIRGANAAQVVAALIAALYVVGVVVAVGASQGPWTSVVAVAVGSTVVCVLVLLVAAAGRLFWVAVVALALSGRLFATMLGVLDEPAGHAARSMVGWRLLDVLAVGTVLLVPSRRLAYASGVLLAVGTVVALAAGVPVSDDFDPVASLLTLAFCLALRPFAHRVLRRRDAEIRRAAAAEAARAAERERLASVVRTQSVLHDTVLSTLAVLALGGEGTDPEEVRALCARDAAMLVDGTLDARPRCAAEARPRDVHDVLARLAHKHSIDLSVHGEEPPLSVPTKVLDELADALDQVLRNVRAHSGVMSATATLQQSEDGFSVTVVDTGRGFDPDAVPVERLGLRRSVSGRIALLGGSVKVWSAPGAGTAVNIVVPWSAATLPGADPADDRRGDHR